MTARQKRLLRAVLIPLLVVGAAGLWIFAPRRTSTYDPGERPEGITADLERERPKKGPGVQFSDVSRAAGIDFVHFPGIRTHQLPEDMGSGAAWGDYDNDGHLDLFLVNSTGLAVEAPRGQRRAAARCALYRNRGDGTFLRTDVQAGIDLAVCGMGAVFVDVDDDGWLDLMVSAYGSLHLWRNRGNGTFEDVSRAWGLDRHQGFWSGLSVADYDRDGLVDVYVCGYVDYKVDPSDRGKVSRQYQSETPHTLNPSSFKPVANLLLHNTGRGFVNVAAAAGAANESGRSLSAAFTDLDDDGWPDLYVANDVSDNSLLINQRNGTFVDRSHTAWVADPRGAMGLAIADLDGDRDSDIYVTHWIAQENALYENKRLGAADGKPRALAFMDIADRVGLGQITLDTIGWATSFIDFDHDGQLDLFAINGSTFQDSSDTSRLVPMRSQLFWNRGPKEGFFEMGELAGSCWMQPSVGRGAAMADYDGDGDLDLVVMNHGARPWLLRNDGGNRQPWLKVRVRPHKNRFGVGAKVTVTTALGTQVQIVGAQPSYLSGNALEAHFGLGGATRIERLRVEFPLGGVVERSGLAANQTVDIGPTP